MKYEYYVKVMFTSNRDIPYNEIGEYIEEAVKEMDGKVKVLTAGKYDKAVIKKRKRK